MKFKISGIDLDYSQIESRVLAYYHEGIKRKVIKN
jgi:hypothetical protein